LKEAAKPWCNVLNPTASGYQPQEASAANSCTISSVLQPKCSLFLQQLQFDMVAGELCNIATRPVVLFLLLVAYSCILLGTHSLCRCCHACLQVITGTVDSFHILVPICKSITNFMKALGFILGFCGCCCSRYLVFILVLVLRFYLDYNAIVDPWW
jgi:hypothetical protein